jgi:hypothetical protein
MERFYQIKCGVSELLTFSCSECRENVMIMGGKKIYFEILIYKYVPSTTYSEN